MGSSRQLKLVLRSCGVLCLALLAAACSLPGGQSPTAAAEATSAVPVPDARLGPVIEELAVHPAWTDGQLPIEVTSVLPTMRHLCVAVRGDTGGDLHVTLDVETTPWTVQAVAVFDDAEGPRVTYEADEVAAIGDLCSFVLLGSPNHFPGDPGDIEVNGAVVAEQAEAIRRAMHSAPARFGIGRDGAPAINLQPAALSPDRTECFEGVVYVGGPRAKVLLGLREEATGWEVQSVRVVEQALHPTTSAPPEGC